MCVSEGVSGRACARVLVNVRVYVRASVYIYICRENVSTVAVFRHFLATDIYPYAGFYEDLNPA